MGLGRFIKKVGRGIKKAVGGVGDVAKFVAPALNFVPGVGPLAAAGIGALGGLAGQLNNKDPSLGAGLREGVMSGAASYGLGAARGGAGGLGGALRRVAGGARDFGNWATASPERTALLTSGFGTAAGAIGAHQADRAANRDAEFARGRATMMDPQRQRLMELFMERLGGGAPAGA